MAIDLNVAVTLPDGSTLSGADFDVLIFDHAKRKLVVARLHPAMRALPLWRGPDYDAIGNWTQEQADARIIEILGDDPQAALQALVLD